MAQYGYSAGYQGGGPQAVPSGFIEAYSQAGRNIGQGAQAIGSAIGESLQRYGQNKEENQFLQTRLESLAPYLKTVAQGGNIMDKNTPESKLLGDIEKFSSMSLPQKKATLLNAEFFLDRADKAKAREMTDAVTAQQLAVAALQLQKGQLDVEDILSARKQRDILSGAVQYGMDQPTTTTQTEQVTTEVPGAPMPPMPGENVPSVQGQPTFNEQGYFEALRRYQETTAPEVNIADIKAQLAQLEPMASETPRQFQIPTLKGGMGGMSSAVDRATITETPQQIAGRISEAIPKVRALRLQLESAQKQPLEMPRREQFLTQVEAQPSAMPAPLSAPLTVTRNVSTQVPISYEDQSKRLTQYLLQQGAKPETLAMVPQILSMVGQRMPTRVEPVGNIGSVVRFGDKEQFVPALKADIGDMLKVKGLTIDFPEFRGTAPTEKEATDFRDQYSSLLSSRRNIQRLVEIAEMGKATQQTPQIKAEAEQLSRAAQGALRLDIIGPGTVTDGDRKLLEAIVRNPTDIFSLQSSNVKSLKSLLERAGSGIESKAKSIGLETIRAQTQPVTGVSSGNFRLVPGKGIQPIQ